MIVHWDNLDDVDQLSFLLATFLGETSILDRKIDSNLITECESRLTEAQKTTYVKYMDMEIAKMVYTPDMSVEEIRSDRTHVNFFWNYATASVQLRARILWHVGANYEL